MKAFFLVSAMAVALSGCAAFPQSSDQVVNLSLQPRLTGYCYLKNERGSWDLLHTPGYVDVLRGTSPLDVLCKGDDGAFGHIFVAPMPSQAAGFGADPGGSAIGSTSGPSSVPNTGNPTNQYDAAFSAYPSNIIVPMTLPNLPPETTVSPLEPAPARVVIHYKHHYHHYVAPACTPKSAPSVSKK
jgi:hypothetical protein